MVLLIVSASCIDSSRVNQSCTWSEASARRLDLSRAADREHLRQDVQLAGELGVRAADVRFRHRPDRGDPIKQACTSAMIDTIARRHGLSHARVAEASYDRLWWADLLAVYLPLAVVLAVGTDYIVRRVRRSFDPEDRLMAAVCVVLLGAVVALLGVGVGQFWAFTIEAAFLRDEHIAFRGSLVPILRHGWRAYLSLLGFCALVALRRAGRSPLRRIERSYASYLGAPARASRASGSRRL
jgi:hypothetical protein